jgi:hypothetical protein
MGSKKEAPNLLAETVDDKIIKAVNTTVEVTHKFVYPCDHHIG